MKIIKKIATTIALWSILTLPSFPTALDRRLNEMMPKIVEKGCRYCY